jgi:MHS family citrate/tricarballylate:H+ symporter-like MFS transporter
LLGAELWLSFLFGAYNGAMIPYLIEIMPVEVRTSGFSVAFSLAAGVFGGFTPAVCTYFIEVTGNRAIPGMWLSLAAALGLIATALLASAGKPVQEARSPAVA